MSTGGTNYDFDAGQRLISSTQDTLDQRNGASATNSRGRDDTFTAGLDGTVKQAAFGRGDRSDTDWQRVSTDNDQSLVQNFLTANRLYSQGQDEAYTTMSASDFKY